MAAGRLRHRPQDHGGEHQGTTQECRRARQLGHHEPDQERRQEVLGGREELQLGGRQMARGAGVEDHAEAELDHPHGEAEGQVARRR